MAWWDDAAEAAGSAIGWLGDAAEAVVDTATDVAEDVTESLVDAADSVLDAVRDVAAAAGPALGAIANVGLGILKGTVHAVSDLVVIVLDVVRNVGKLLSDALHLNLPGIIGDLGNIVTDVLVLAWPYPPGWVWRVITGGYFAKEVSDYFMRDRALTFIRNLIIDEFGKAEGEDILRNLGAGSAHFGLPITASVRIMAADSNTFPFVPLHSNGVLDLFALAGLLSFDSFRIDRERTRVVRVNANGQNMLFPPINRFAIRSFLASNGTSMRIRAFAMTPYATAKAMRTAFRKFKKLCIDVNWTPSFHVTSFGAFPTQPCRNLTDFSFLADPVGIDSLWFASSTPRNGALDQDATPLCIAIFGYSNQKNGNQKNGLTSGRVIKRGSPSFSSCSGSDTTDACTTDIARHMRDFAPFDPNNELVANRPDAETGCGCTWRDTYPPFFSRLVLAHELGHYFGLTHAGHNGADKIMLSVADGSAVVGSDSWWRAWLYGDAVFTEEDVENAWRFIVRKMPHVLRAL